MRSIRFAVYVLGVVVITFLALEDYLTVSGQIVGLILWFIVWKYICKWLKRRRNNPGKGSNNISK